MKAYMLRSEKRIDPLGDHPSECLVTNRRLRDLQQEVLQQLDLQLIDVASGAQVEDTEEHIVFEDSLLFTKELLEEFITRSRELQRCTICALKPGLVALRSVVATQEVQIHDDRVEYGLQYLTAQKQRGESVPVVIDPGEEDMSVPFPRHVFGTPGYRVAVTDKVLVQIDHWVNLWSAGMLMVLSEFARLKKAPQEFWADIMQKAGSMNQWDILCQLNNIGKNCDIHPTAYIEGSTLGDNVTVGAGSVIRNALVGDGAYIGSNSLLQACVIGEECFIINGVNIQVSVMYPRGVVNNRFTESSLLGSDIFIAEGVVLTDFRFDGRCVPVLKDGVQVDTGNPLIGSCVGHGVYLGAGCIIAPGRTIPNSLRLVPEPTRIIREVSPDGIVPGYRRIGV